MNQTDLPHARLANADEAVALRVAAESIEHGLHQGRPLIPSVEECSAVLQECWPAFVTLHTQGNLRGCVGTTEGVAPLISNVARFAHAAAFGDSRFSSIQWGDLDTLTIHVSVLSRSEPLHFRTETELLRQLRPGIDGLILEIEGARATFLPSVWESLPAPEEFLAALRHKMGLPRDYWSPEVRARRYTAQCIAAPEGTWLLAKSTSPRTDSPLPPPLAV